MPKRLNFPDPEFLKDEGKHYMNGLSDFSFKIHNLSNVVSSSYFAKDTFYSVVSVRKKVFLIEMGNQ